MTRFRRLALGAFCAGAPVWGLACAAGDSARHDVADPSATDIDVEPEPPPARARSDRRDAGVAARLAPEAAAPAPPPRPVPPEPAYGVAESPRPADAHAFRLAGAMRAMRASQSGAKVVKLLSVIPDVIDAKARTGVDPFGDAEWFLVYGPAVGVPGPNANVVKHTRPEAAVASALADGGFEGWDAAGPRRPSGSTGTTGTTGALASRELFGVRDVLLRPQPGLLALVPGDRAPDLATALAKSVDPGVRPGELARVFVAEPSRLARFVPAELVGVTVVFKAAPDGGLDASAEAACPDAGSCTSTAASFLELAKRSNSMMVRIVTKNLLGGLSVRADGAKLKAALHAAPDQVDALLNLVRSQLGLPAVDVGQPAHRP